ncbi:MAG: DUF4198 domain-containing protein [Pseudomonadota bacterium]
MTIQRTLLAAALAACASLAHAHLPWIMPTSGIVEAKDAWVTIDGAVTDNYFDIDHQALKLDGTTITDPDGAGVALPPVLTGRMRSSFDLKLAKNGTYKVALVTRNVVASYRQGGEAKRWRGAEEALAANVPAGAEELRTLFQHARLETFVTANKASSGALKASGAGLEMVPVTHPNDLRAGEQATLRFVLDGKPLANFAFSLIPGGVRYRGVLGEVRLTTDANGQATFTLPAPGMVALVASYPAAPVKPGEGPAVQRRYSYGATLEILPQ